MAEFTTGLEFLADVRSAEDRCAKETWEALPHTGRQVPRSLTGLGDLLSLTYRAATCYWGCIGPFASSAESELHLPPLPGSWREDFAVDSTGAGGVTCSQSRAAAIN